MPSSIKLSNAAPTEDTGTYTFPAKPSVQSPNAVGIEEIGLFRE